MPKAYSTRTAQVDKLNSLEYYSQASILGDVYVEIFVYHVVKPVPSHPIPTHSPPLLARSSEANLTPARAWLSYRLAVKPGILVFNRLSVLHRVQPLPQHLVPP
jgi:hypothetical protein